MKLSFYGQKMVDLVIVTILVRKLFSKIAKKPLRMSNNYLFIAIDLARWTT